MKAESADLPHCMPKWGCSARSRTSIGVFEGQMPGKHVKSAGTVAVCTLTGAARLLHSPLSGSSAEYGNSDDLLPLAIEFLVEVIPTHLMRTVVILYGHIQRHSGYQDSLKSFLKLLGICRISGFMHVQSELITFEHSRPLLGPGCSLQRPYVTPKSGLHRWTARFQSFESCTTIASCTRVQNMQLKPISVGM